MFIRFKFVVIMDGFQDSLTIIQVRILFEEDTSSEEKEHEENVREQVLEKNKDFFLVVEDYSTPNDDDN